LGDLKIDEKWPWGKLWGKMRSERGHPTLAAAVAFTAPGRAVANWVGEQIGLSGPGEPGGPPALRQLNESWGLGRGGWKGEKFVLLVGPVTGEERSRWEFILSEST
jgi:hypothetical protein